MEQKKVRCVCGFIPEDFSKKGYREHFLFIPNKEFRMNTDKMYEMFKHMSLVDIECNISAGKFFGFLSEKGVCSVPDIIIPSQIQCIFEGEILEYINVSYVGTLIGKCTARLCIYPHMSLDNLWENMNALNAGQIATGNIEQVFISFGIWNPIPDWQRILEIDSVNMDTSSR
jgi:hypothetical protein